MMKLLTEEIKRKLAKYPIYSQDDKGEEALILCKFFNPYGDQTWYILEGDQEGNDYYLFTLFEDCHGREYGYVMLSELQNLRVPPFRLGIERDKYFKPCKVSELPKI